MLIVFFKSDTKMPCRFARFAGFAYHHDCASTCDAKNLCVCTTQEAAKKNSVMKGLIDQMREMLSDMNMWRIMSDVPKQSK